MAKREVSKFIECAVAKSRARPALTYALRDGQHTIAIDGWRMHIETGGEDEKRLIPTESSDKYADGNETVNSFPSWAAILPSYYTHTFTAYKEELLSAVELAMVFSKHAENTVVLVFRGETIGVIGASFEHGDIETAVYAPENKNRRSEFEISYDGTYLLDALKGMSGDLIEIAIAVGSNMISISNDAGNQQALIMPKSDHNGISRRDARALTMTANPTYWNTEVPAACAAHKAHKPKAARKPKPTVKPREPQIIEYRNGAGCQIVEYVYDPLVAIWNTGGLGCSFAAMTCERGLYAAEQSDHSIVFWKGIAVFILRMSAQESLLELYNASRWDDSYRRVASVKLPALTPAMLAEMFKRLAAHPPIAAAMPAWVGNMVEFAHQTAPAVGAA